MKKIILTLISLFILISNVQAKEQSKNKLYSSYTECIKDQTAHNIATLNMFLSMSGSSLYENDFKKEYIKSQASSLKYCLQFRKKLFHFKDK